MPDVINAKGTPSISHPSGQFVAQCVDTIDLGESVESFAGQPDKLVPKCALVFRTGERTPNGEYFDISREFTVSMGDKANLRKFLEQWRGKAYTNEQIEEGVPLHKLAGNHALLTVAPHTSKAGKVSAIITACVGIPKQMQGNLPKYDDYTRADWWEKRKKEYAEAAAKFRAEHAPARVPAGVGGGDDFEDFPGALQDEDDDLPF